MQEKNERSLCLLHIEALTNLGLEVSISNQDDTYDVRVFHTQIGKVLVRCKGEDLCAVMAEAHRKVHLGYPFLVDGDLTYVVCPTCGHTHPRYMCPNQKQNKE